MDRNLLWSLAGLNPDEWFQMLGFAPKEKQESLLKFLREEKIPVKFFRQSDFDEYVEGLPDVESEGFLEEIDDWFRNWGNGGGDYSTETCVRAVEETNIRNWAIAAFREIADYSKSPYDAFILISLAIDEVLSSLVSKGKISLDK